MPCGPRLLNGLTVWLRQGFGNAQIRYQNRMADGVGQVVRAAERWIDWRPVDRTGSQISRGEADDDAADSAAALPRALSRSNEDVEGRNVWLSGKERMSLTSDNPGLFHTEHCSYQSRQSKPRGLRKVCSVFTLRQRAI
jgi:hypothetical protein